MSQDAEQPCIRPAFWPGDVVAHISDSGAAQGVITAFMVRGNNHSYEVSWGTDKSLWHLDFELVRPAKLMKPIGFWAETGTPQKHAR